MVNADYIERHEIEPATQAEWEVALDEYARDGKEDDKPPSDLDAGPNNVAVAEDRPTVHHSSSDDSVNSTRSQSRQGMLPLKWPAVSEDDEVIIGDTQVRSGELERTRKSYEENGWLPGPKCSRETRRARNRVLQRLGLVSEVNTEQRVVLANYAQMAKMVYSTATAFVTVMHNETVHAQSTDTGCGHVAVRRDDSCFVVADMSRDWRFKNNPVYKISPWKFYAAAPLRFQTKNGGTIHFGTLCVYDDKPRETFDNREQEMLQKLAGMLVHQLATLHSSAMYEATLGFLRRAVITDQSDASTEDKHETKNESQPLRAKSEDNRSGAPSGSLVRKSGPRRNPRDTSDDELFADAAATHRRILNADAVAIVSMEDYQLFLRRTSESHARVSKEDKEKIIRDHVNGRPWPAYAEPVVSYVPRNWRNDVPVLGLSVNEGQRFQFNDSTVPSILGGFLHTYLTQRRFWWDDEDQDSTSQDIMSLMPAGTQTVLATAYMTYDGKIRFATFATWNRPPSAFIDTTATALPFAWTLSGCIMAALAIRKMRAIEQSQISYSNLQAHELRTPLHQILAMTQLLRSSMDDISSETAMKAQVGDLLPFLDAIDNGGRSLHGIVDNILSYLDLQARDETLAQGYFGPPPGAQMSLEQMCDDIVRDASEENKRARKANGRTHGTVETVFEIIPALLGEQVSEDTAGALRRALSKLIANAYKFLEEEGCVEIYVDDIPELMPPEGFVDIALAKIVGITIIDNGPGMDQSFVNEKLGEPWAKEDQYASGSGLSVHLAYRIIDLMGGHMEIASAPGAGCKVKIEVPLPTRELGPPESSNSNSDQSRKPSSGDLESLTVHPARIGDDRKIAVAGFDNVTHPRLGLPKLGESLVRQFAKLGCEMVPIEKADLVLFNGEVETDETVGLDLLKRVKTDNVVFLVAPEHEANQTVLKMERDLTLDIRRFRKPVSPSILREILVPRHAEKLKDLGEQVGNGSNTINEPVYVDEHGNRIKTSGDPVRDGQKVETNKLDPAEKRPHRGRGASEFDWKPDDVSVSDAVAALSLGEKVDAEIKPSPFDQSPVHTPFIEPSNVFPGFKRLHEETHVDDQGKSEGHEEPIPEISVLVVEDNTINRKILVKIVASLAGYKIFEAEDGVVAVEQFRKIKGPLIVLLDINMPHKDGYNTAIAMRAIEEGSDSHREMSRIIAVTALSSEEERRRGLKECGMDEWLVKPCGKAIISKAVENARIHISGHSTSSTTY